MVLHRRTHRGAALARRPPQSSIAIPYARHTSFGSVIVICHQVNPDEFQAPVGLFTTSQAKLV